MVEKLKDIVYKAGNQLIEVYDVDKLVSFKTDTDLVTQYDKDIEEKLVEELSQAFHGYDIVGEESSNININSLPKDAIFIDPIDGTTNFVHGFKIHCISVGIYKGGVPHCGVIYAPLLNEMYYAEKGKGAYLNNKRIIVSQNEELMNSLFNASLSVDPKVIRKSLPIFNELLFKTRGARIIGSAALSLCYVAQGIFDAYYGLNFYPWDIAAGILIVQEAGGTVTDFQNITHDMTKKELLASNSKLHLRYLQEIKKSIL